MVNYLIIGADAAGLSAAVQIKQKKPDASIRVYNKGKIISYGACGIPYVLSGDIPSAERLVHFTPDSIFKMRGIPVEIEQEAISINPKKHIVEIKDLKTGKVFKESYKKLLIATGAIPKKLPFIDYLDDGVFNLHNIEDLKRTLEYIQRKRPKKVAVIGAGNIGLEITEALRKMELEVFLFEVFPEPAFMWPGLIRKAVIEKIKEKSVHFIGNTAIKNVERSGISYVLETEKDEYFADMVFSVIGTKPAVDFCGDSLLKNSQGALIIDKRGRTSDEDVYAAGDCATVFHKLLNRQVYFPLGSTANKMGRIAGLNLSGEILLFPGIVGTQIFKFFELSLAKTGLSQEEAEKEGIEAKMFSALRMDKAGYYPGAESAKVQIVIDERSKKIIGAAAVCMGNAAQFIDPAAVAVFSGMNVLDLGWFDSAYAPPFAPVWNALISAALKASKT